MIEGIVSSSPSMIFKVYFSAEVPSPTNIVFTLKRDLIPGKK